MPKYIIIKYSDNYVKILRIMWQYRKDDLNDNRTDSELFKFKAINNKTFPTVTGNAKDFEIAVLSKYLCYFWRSLEIPLVN